MELVKSRSRLQADSSICFDIYLLPYAQSWTPDDGRKDRPKHVVCYPKLNKFKNWCILLILL